jgi:hypothetical protein
MCALEGPPHQTKRRRRAHSGRPPGRAGAPQAAAPGSLYYSATDRGRGVATPGCRCSNESKSLCRGIRRNPPPSPEPSAPLAPPAPFAPPARQRRLIRRSPQRRQGTARSPRSGVDASADTATQRDAALDWREQGNHRHCRSNLSGKRDPKAQEEGRRATPEEKSPSHPSN